MDLTIGDLRKSLSELKTLPILVIPVVLIMLIIFGIIGIANRDIFNTGVSNDDNYIQSFQDEIPIIILNSNNEEILLTAEVAQTQEDIRQGLMNRSFLPYNRGMLFVFENSKVRTFWMKDTFIPLDMIFIDENKNIVDIIQNAQPLDESRNKYVSAQPAKYVIEVNAGWTSDNQIQQGDRVTF